MRTKMAVACMALFAAPAWAATPSLPAPDPGRGSVAISIRDKAPIRLFHSSAVQVFFVRLDEETNLLKAETVLPSNFSRGKQVFLLNAKPGRYVAVASSLRAMGTKVFFSRDLILLTEVTVVPGELSFAGEYRITTAMNLEQADAAQSIYMQLIAAGAAGKGYLARSFSGEDLVLGALESAAKTPADERRFWEEARAEAFAGEERWQQLTAQRLAAIPVS